MSNTSRRQFLEATFKIGGTVLLASFTGWKFGRELTAVENILPYNPIRNGIFIENIDFLGEGDVLLNSKLNSGLDGRYYKDLEGFNGYINRFFNKTFKSNFPRRIKINLIWINCSYIE